MTLIIVVKNQWHCVKQHISPRVLGDLVYLITLDVMVIYLVIYMLIYHNLNITKLECSLLMYTASSWHNATTVREVGYYSILGLTQQIYGCSYHL